MANFESKESNIILHMYVGMCGRMEHFQSNKITAVYPKTVMKSVNAKKEEYIQLNIHMNGQNVFYYK